MREVVLRRTFTAAERLSPAWRLSKGANEARCEIWSHAHGFEVRLFEEFQQRTAVCFSHEELIVTCVTWRREFLNKGWRDRM